jgi:streptomycin 6-kinase
MVASAHLPELVHLAAIETRWLGGSDGDTLHGDINASNVLIGPDGKTWLVDWAQPICGAAWIDVADLIPHLILAGHALAQAERAVAAVPAWTGTPPGTITSYAAAFAGY